MCDGILDCLDGMTAHKLDQTDQFPHLLNVYVTGDDRRVAHYGRKQWSVRSRKWKLLQTKTFIIIPSLVSQKN